MKGKQAAKAARRRALEAAEAEALSRSSAAALRRRMAEAEQREAEALRSLLDSSGAVAEMMDDERTLVDATRRRNAKLSELGDIRSAVRLAATSTFKDMASVVAAPDDVVVELSNLQIAFSQLGLLRLPGRFGDARWRDLHWQLHPPGGTGNSLVPDDVIAQIRAVE